MLLCWIHVVSRFNEDLNHVAAVVITDGGGGSIKQRRSYGYCNFN